MLKKNNTNIIIKKKNKSKLDKDKLDKDELDKDELDKDKLDKDDIIDINNTVKIKKENKSLIDESNIILKELLNKQLKNINIQNKLNFNDIKRISKFLTTSIFDDNKCSLCNVYIKNENNNLKGTYINFYYNKKKIALHRLLYENYIDRINEDDYIKFTCQNKGKCCNINHLKKFSYNKNDVIVNNNQNLDNNIKINLDKNKLTLEF